MTRAANGTERRDPTDGVVPVTALQAYVRAAFREAFDAEMLAARPKDAAAEVAERARARIRAEVDALFPAPAPMPSKAKPKAAA